MKRDDPRLEPELEAFLKHRPIERRVPPEVRARALARARAVSAAGGRLADAPFPPSPATPAAPAPRRRVPFRIALAASVAIAGIALGALAALHGHGAGAPPPMMLPEQPSPAPIAPASKFSGSSLEPAAPRAERPAPADPPRALHGPAKRDPFSAGLELLQRAHAAYTRRDFPLALALIADHARRFPNGHLAEQREALRVRSLEGAGRTDEARVAAAAFAVRFPRSVLLPRVGGASQSAIP